MIIFDCTYHDYGYNRLLFIYRTFIGTCLAMTSPQTFEIIFTFHIDGMKYRSTDMVQKVHIDKVKNFTI